MKMSQKVFLHGVPDTPAMWAPVIDELGLTESEYVAPAMPGFSTPIPAGFSCTKEAYVDWYISILEAIASKSGPSDIVGHDWGALITFRVASLRPDLVRTWTVANALPHPDYEWHTMAKRWQTPIIGEIMMMLIGKKPMAKAMAANGVPATLAEEEIRHWNGDMKKAILKLYRSAKHAGTEWYPDIKALSEKGMIFWGNDDPYVQSWVAEKVAADTGARLEGQDDSGHWSVLERKEELARLLKDHWA
jgi:pimeloyl-ACP methyl ester carboxylesterase